MRKQVLKFGLVFSLLLLTACGNEKAVELITPVSISSSVTDVSIDKCRAIKHWDEQLLCQLTNCIVLPPIKSNYPPLKLILNLNKDTTIKDISLASDANPNYTKEPSYINLAQRNIQAIRQCFPMDYLPSDKYDVWMKSEILLDFSTHLMK